MSKQGNVTPQQKQVLAVFILLSGLATTPHAFDASTIDNVLRADQACHADTNPALAVSVVKDGQVLLSSGCGLTRIGGNEEVTSSTRFNIASLTKAFTATLLLKVMEEDGRFNLSTKVRDIMGESFEFGDDFRTQEATVEDILAHKMAIPSNNRLRFNSNLTRANLKDRLKYLKSPDGFRNIYIYNNLMYGLATRMTEIIGNKRWEDLVKSHLFGPLKMSRSTFAKNAIDDASGTAKPYKLHFGTLKPVSHRLPFFWSEMAGSGAIVSTADDMAEWMKFHLSKGKGPGGKQVMTEDTVEELYKPRTAMNKPSMSKFQQPNIPVTFSHDIYGMGFRRGYYRGIPILGHGGSSYGYRSLLTLIPSQNIGVFTIMTGGDSGYPLRGTLHAYLMDQALNVASWLNSSTLCSFPAPWFNTTSRIQPPYNTSIPLAYNTSAYVGLYHNPAYGTFDVREWQDSEDGLDDGREPSARLTLFYGFATWDLLPLPKSSSSSSSSAEEAFYGKGRNITAWVNYSPFMFHAPPAGSDVIIEMSAPGLESRSPPVFVRVGSERTGSGGRIAYNPLLLFSVLLLTLM